MRRFRLRCRLLRRRLHRSHPIREWECLGAARELDRVDHRRGLGADGLPDDHGSGSDRFVQLDDRPSMASRPSRVVVPIRLRRTVERSPGGPTVAESPRHLSPMPSSPGAVSNPSSAPRTLVRRVLGLAAGRAHRSGAWRTRPNLPAAVLRRTTTRSDIAAPGARRHRSDESAMMIFTVSAFVLSPSASRCQCGWPRAR